MYYEIEGLYEMPAVIFDEDRIVTGKKEYLYSHISDIKITNSIAFSAYAILKLTYDGKTVSIPFNRHYLKTAKRAIKELEHQKASGNSDGTTSSIPFEALKQLKELKDMGAITEAEFEAKKKQLLDL